jgi:hypothetical protein
MKQHKTKKRRPLRYIAAAKGEAKKSSQRYEWGNKKPKARRGGITTT